MGPLAVGVEKPTAIRAFWSLSRPQLFPYVLFTTLGGLAWAHWDQLLIPPRGSGQWWILAVAWWALHAGTLWLNADLDRDEGEVLFGGSVPLPKHLVAFGYLALVICVGLGFLAGTIAGWCAVLCSVLAVLYSHPRVAWKGHPIGGPAINGIGYGLLSPLAGWSLAEVSPNARTVCLWLICLFGVLSAYFVAQVFQEEEDRARGYRTLVASHGSKAVVLAARICTGAAFVAGGALVLCGLMPRLCIVLVPSWLWIDRWLSSWKQIAKTSIYAQVFVQRVFSVAALGALILMADFVRRIGLWQ